MISYGKNEVKLRQLKLIRGLPGSGKSTLAQQFASEGWLHYEADHFFERNGQYVFDPSLIGQAHQDCFDRTESSLCSGQDVVVANTFVEQWEIAPYWALARRYDADFTVQECTGQFASIHGVPEKSLLAMSNRWQNWPNDILHVALLLFSHRLTPAQTQELWQRWRAVPMYLPNHLQELWSQVPTYQQVPDLAESARPLFDWIQKMSAPADPILIQGDYGLCHRMILHSLDLDLIPIYSTTERSVVEKTDENGVVHKSATFLHGGFRTYNETSTLTHQG